MRTCAFRRHGFAWVTGGFFLVSLLGHWVFGWFAYVNEQQDLHQPVIFSSYLVEMGRDTLENWQSEFLQLLWQVAGLALLLHVGSPQSKKAMTGWKPRLTQFCWRSLPIRATKPSTQSIEPTKDVIPIPATNTSSRKRSGPRPDAHVGLEIRRRLVLIGRLAI